jgi:hypothetical protein
MSGKQERRRRQATRDQMARHLWESSPLSADRKLRLMALARYVAARLRGDTVPPPADWTPEQLAEFEAILASPQERAGMIRWAMDGYRELEAETNAALNGECA